MRIGYLLDLNKGGYGQPLPDRDDVHDTLHAMVDEAHAAEEAGFHSIGISDRHGRTEVYWPGPMQILSILARETQRVAIGTYCLVHTLWHPMVIAEQTAVADNLSRGRFFHCLGRGYHPGYWDYFGIPQERMLGRFLEGVRCMEQAFASRGEPFTFDGDFYQVKDQMLSPQPWQEHLPIWGSGQAPPAIKRAASYGDSWAGDPFPLEKTTWDREVGAYREAAESRGKKPYVILMRDGWVADSFDDAMKEFGTNYLDEVRFYARHGIVTHHPDFQREEDFTPESTREHLVIGNAEECIAQIEKYRQEYGVDYVMMRFRMTNGPSFEAVREQLRRFGAEVCSHFNERYPAHDHPAIPEGARW